MCCVSCIGAAKVPSRARVVDPRTKGRATNSVHLHCPLAGLLLGPGAVFMPFLAKPGGRGVTTPPP
eukprot:9467756-Pyramimonas_sp.AAC.1